MSGKYMFTVLAVTFFIFCMVSAGEAQVAPKGVEPGLARPEAEESSSFVDPFFFPDEEFFFGPRVFVSPFFAPGFFAPRFFAPRFFAPRPGFFREDD